MVEKCWWNLRQWEPHWMEASVLLKFDRRRQIVTSVKCVMPDVNFWHSTSILMSINKVIQSEMKFKCKESKFDVEVCDFLCQSSRYSDPCIDGPMHNMPLKTSVCIHPLLTVPPRVHNLQVVFAAVLAHSFADVWVFFLGKIKIKNKILLFYPQIETSPLSEAAKLFASATRGTATPTPEGETHKQG